MVAQSSFKDLHLVQLENILVPLSSTGSTMRPDEVQGFMVALASGPDKTDMAFWLNEVLGDVDRSTMSEEQIATLKILLQAMMDDIMSNMQQGQMPELVLYAKEDADEPDYWAWCNAYLYALDLVDTDWFEAANDEGFEDLLYPIMALGGIFEEEDGEPLVSFSDAELKEFEGDVDDAVMAVFNYWRAKEKAPKTVKNDNKVGRNDPCPCGSSKKYKACCGKN